MAKKKETIFTSVLRIPTATRYAYIEVSVKGTAKEVVDAYYAVSSAYWGQQKKRKKIVEATRDTVVEDEY